MLWKEHTQLRQSKANICENWPKMNNYNADHHAKCHFWIVTGPLISRTTTIIGYTKQIIKHRKNYILRWCHLLASVPTLQLRVSTPIEIGVLQDKFSFATNQFTQVLADLILSVNSLLKWRHSPNLQSSNLLMRSFVFVELIKNSIMAVR